MRSGASRQEPSRQTPMTSGGANRQIGPLLAARGDRAHASGYIMEGPGETERLRAKTQHVLVRRHLDWTGVGRGESFADFGCGTGEVVLAAARLCCPGRVTGVDNNPDRLASLLERAEASGLTHVDSRMACISGVGSTGLKDDAFDHAWARFFLEYQPRPREVLAEMARIVRPGGRVTIIDLEGNGVWHYGMDEDLEAGLSEIVTDLRATGFDPHIGRRLPVMARAAGLIDVRHDVEPYHRIVGRPDAGTAAAWRRKIDGLRASYLNRLFPHKRHLAWVFDAYQQFLLRDDTMTWSLLHLVQGTVPTARAARYAAAR
jgi:ubiquinone/menaquinone biosynthesis C-methylase UbiE